MMCQNIDIVSFIKSDAPMQVSLTTCDKKYPCVDKKMKVDWTFLPLGWIGTLSNVFHGNWYCNVKCHLLTRKQWRNHLLTDQVWWKSFYFILYRKVDLPVLIWVREMAHDGTRYCNVTFSTPMLVSCQLQTACIICKCVITNTVA